MKKCMITLALLLGVVSLNAQDEIEGFWLAGEGKSIVEIYKGESNNLFGKVVWLNEPNDKKGNPKTDRMNKDKSLRDRPIIDMNMIEDLSYQDGKWEGSLYVIKRGRTVPVTVSLTSDDQLSIKVSFMGRTGEKLWERTNSPK